MCSFYTFHMIFKFQMGMRVTKLATGDNRVPFMIGSLLVAGTGFYL